MMRHSGYEISHDVDSYHLSVLHRNKDAKACSEGDYARIHYKGYLAINNKRVLDTREKFGDDHPVEISVGNYNDIKCFDMALQQAHAGDKLKIDCPSRVAFQGKTPYSHFGSDPIPENSDMKFSLEVLSCSTYHEKAEVPKKVEDTSGKKYKHLSIPDYKTKLNEGRSIAHTFTHDLVRQQDQLNIDKKEWGQKLAQAGENDDEKSIWEALL